MVAVVIYCRGYRLDIVMYDIVAIILLLWLLRLIGWPLVESHDCSDRMRLL